MLVRTRILETQGAAIARAVEICEDRADEPISDTQRTSATRLPNGAWPGDTEFPKFAMERHAVVAEETQDDVEPLESGPTRVFLQTGDGGRAAACNRVFNRDRRSGSERSGCN